MQLSGFLQARRSHRQVNDARMLGWQERRTQVETLERDIQALATRRPETTRDAEAAFAPLRDRVQLWAQVDRIGAGHLIQDLGRAHWTQVRWLLDSGSSSRGDGLADRSALLRWAQGQFEDLSSLAEQHETHLSPWSMTRDGGHPLSEVLRQRFYVVSSALDRGRAARDPEVGAQWMRWAVQEARDIETAAKANQVPVPRWGREQTGREPVELAMLSYHSHVEHTARYHYDLTHTRLRSAVGQAQSWFRHSMREARNVRALARELHQEGRELPRPGGRPLLQVVLQARLDAAGELLTYAQQNGVGPLRSLGYAPDRHWQRAAARVNGHLAAYRNEILSTLALADRHGLDLRGPPAEVLEAVRRARAGRRDVLLELPTHTELLTEAGGPHAAGAALRASVPGILAESLAAHRRAEDAWIAAGSPWQDW